MIKLKCFFHLLSWSFSLLLIVYMVKSSPPFTSGGSRAYLKCRKAYAIMPVGKKDESAHYGTEIYVMGVSDDDITFFKNAMSTYTEDDFSIAIN